MKKFIIKTKSGDVIDYSNNIKKLIIFSLIKISGRTFNEAKEVIVETFDEVKKNAKDGVVTTMGLEIAMYNTRKIEMDIIKKITKELSK